MGDNQGAPNFKSISAFVEDDFSFVTETLAEIPIVGGLLNRILGIIHVDKLKPHPLGGKALELYS